MPRVSDLVEKGAIAATDKTGRVVPIGSEADPGGAYRAVMPWFSEGREVYRRSLILALDLAVSRKLPGATLWVEHALSLGYRCRLENGPSLDSAEICRMLAAGLSEIALEGITFESMIDARSSGRDHPLLEWCGSGGRLDLNCLGASCAFASGPVVPDTSWLDAFELRPEGSGFVLRFPGSADWPAIGEWQERPRLAREFDLEEKHGARLGVRTVSELNSRIEKDGGLEVVAMSHFYQEYRLIEIVMALESMFPGKRIIMIAGPSSSGKTTTTRLLGMFLRAQGFGVKSISVDNYFKNRSETPRDQSGNYDFESLDALETGLFGRHLADLLAGREVKLPRFDFTEGRRIDDLIPVHLLENDFLMIEGIHGLNDALTPGVDPASKYRIYVSALTQLNIDRLTRMSTTDSRLLRRMIRDSRTRGYSAEETIAAWPSVKRGERINIFPYQEMADAMFNSSLPYELPVLKPFAEPLLATVPEGSPAYNTADRLKRLLSFVLPIDASVVPKLSLLREFIGGLLLGEEGH